MSEGTALVGMGMASLWAQDFDRALTESGKGIAIAEAVDAKRVLAHGHLNNAGVYGVTGHLNQAWEEIEQTLTMSQVSGNQAHQAAALTLAGLFKNWEGDYPEAVRLFAEGLQIARAHSLVLPLMSGLWQHGITLTGKGDYDEALVTFEEGLAVYEKVGNEVLFYRVLNSVGWLYSELGDLHRALDFNQRGAEGARRRGEPETIANAELNLGDIFLAQGDLTLAHEFFEGIYRIAQDAATSAWAKWRYSMHLFVSLGELWLARGELAKAQEFADRCLDIATRTTSRKYEVRGKRLRGEIALAQRQWEETEAWLRQALLLARTVGNPPQLWKTYVAMGHLFREMKQPAHAQEFYQGARDVIYRIKVTLHNSELRTSLEQSPLTQAIYELSTSG
jgi:tetratricopeptide (TPR) repeat protein